jgi:hypothetical protein
MNPRPLGYERRRHCSAQCGTGWPIAGGPSGAAMTGPTPEGKCNQRRRPDVMDVNTHVCRSEPAPLGSGSSVSMLGPGTLANSLSP